MRRSTLGAFAVAGCGALALVPLGISQAEQGPGPAPATPVFWLAEETDFSFVLRDGTELDPTQSFELVLETTLSGQAEVTDAGVPGAGDLDASGAATVTISEDLSICWTIDVQGLQLPAMAAHIHEAPAGANGPIVVPLSAPDATGHAEGCTTGEFELVDRIASDPEGFYVNVHNEEFPAGAARGQLSGEFFAPQVGDRLFIAEDLFASDAAGTKGPQVGRTLIQCTVGVAESLQCAGTAFLDGRGQVHLSATVPFTEEEQASFDVAVVGGTGEFADAGGDATLADLPSEDDASRTLYAVRLLHLAG